jgi:hypothetical protein
MKWMKGAKEGIIIASGRGPGSGLTHLCNPRGLGIDQLGIGYVADCINYRIIRWVKGATQGTIVVGRDGQGGYAKQFDNSWGVLLDREGNRYVSPYGNCRIQKFNIGLISNP